MTTSDLETDHVFWNIIKTFKSKILSLSIVFHMYETARVLYPCLNWQKPVEHSVQMGYI